MRILDARIHGLPDPVAVIPFLVGPLLFGLGGSPAAIACTLAIVHLLVHGIVELVVGIALLILPPYAGYAPGSPARRFHLGMGALILVVWALIAYGARAPQPSAEAWAKNPRAPHRAVL